MNKPLIILLVTATESRLDSIAARASYALMRAGAVCTTVDCSTLDKVKDFFKHYKNNGFRGIDFIFLKQSFYVDMAVRKKANGSLWTNDAVLPDLSFLVEYSDWLHDKFMPSKSYRPPENYYSNLPARAFGAHEHHVARVEKDMDEIFVSGQILGAIHRFQDGKFLEG